LTAYNVKRVRKGTFPGKNALLKGRGGGGQTGKGGEDLGTIIKRISLTCKKERREWQSKHKEKRNNAPRQQVLPSPRKKRGKGRGAIFSSILGGGENLELPSWCPRGEGGKKKGRVYPLS